MNVRITKVFEEKGTSLSQMLESKEFFDVLERAKQLTSQLEILRGQLSDNKLDSIIKSLLDKQREIDIARTPIIEAINNPQRADAKTMGTLNTEEQALRDVQRKELIILNKRIDELLSGEA